MGRASRKWHLAVVVVAVTNVPDGIGLLDFMVSGANVKVLSLVALVGPLYLGCLAVV